MLRFVQRIIFLSLWVERGVLHEGEAENSGDLFGQPLALS